MGASKLVIVESPAKAATIEGYLGPDYHVTASIGHIRDLPQPKELPTDMKKGPYGCLLYTSPSPRDLSTSRMPSSA